MNHYPTIHITIFFFIPTKPIENRSMAGIELDLKTGVSEEEMEAFAPLSKGLVLRVCRPGDCPPLGGQDSVTQSNAILRTLATARPDSLLYGKNEFESAQVRVGGGWGGGLRGRRVRVVVLREPGPLVRARSRGCAG